MAEYVKMLHFGRLLLLARWYFHQKTNPAGSMISTAAHEALMPKYGEAGIVILFLPIAIILAASMKMIIALSQHKRILSSPSWRLAIFSADRGQSTPRPSSGYLLTAARSNACIVVVAYG